MMRSTRRIEGKRGAIALLAMLACVTGARAVVGPSTPDEALAPSMVMVLQRSGNVAGFCSGIVLGARAVLTAAHCAPAGADLRIHFRDGEGKPVLLPVSEAIRHPGYRADAVATRQRSIDLAILRLPADLPERFRPATLGRAAGAGLGSRFRVAGYGVTREQDGSSSGQLRVAAVTTRAPLSSVLLWARGSERRGGACTGDSGGPILDADADIVEAVTLWSAGSGRSRCGDLTQAIWIGPLRPWIDDVLSR